MKCVPAILIGLWAVAVVADDAVTDSGETGTAAPPAPPPRVITADGDAAIASPAPGKGVEFITGGGSNDGAARVSVLPVLE